MSRSRNEAGRCGGLSQTSVNPFFTIFILAVLLLSNSTPCIALPLQTSRDLSITTRALFWKPSAGLTWNYQLTGNINLDATKVDVWDIDLFDATTSTIDKIHAQGKRVICYFSAGSTESWRPDVYRFQSYDKGNPVQGWQGENWLQIRSSNVRNIMLARLDLAKQKKCDGVEPDNVDGYDNNNGLQLTANDAVDYVNFLADAAHSRNMAIGLKNAGSIVPRLVAKVEYSIQEECVQYGNCQEFAPFIKLNKPVFHVEYSNAAAEKRAAWTKNDSNRGDEGDLSGNDTEAFMNIDSASVPIIDVANADGSSGREASEAPLVPPTSSDESIAEVAADGKAGSVAVRSVACVENVPGFSTIMKNLGLDAWIQICY